MREGEDEVEEDSDWAQGELLLWLGVTATSLQLEEISEISLSCRWLWK